MKPKEIVDKPQNVLKDNKYFIHHVTIVYFLSFIGFRNNLKQTVDTVKLFFWVGQKGRHIPLRSFELVEYTHSNYSIKNCYNQLQNMNF